MLDVHSAEVAWHPKFEESHFSRSYKSNQVHTRGIAGNCEKIATVESNHESFLTNVIFLR